LTVWLQATQGIGVSPHIALGERIDHRFAKPLLVIEHVMRNAQRFADAARVVDILAGAAGAGAMHGSAMIVELQRDAEHVIALAFQQAGHDGGINAAGHGNDDTCVFGLTIKIETVHGIQSGIPVHRRVFGIFARPYPVSCTRPTPQQCDCRQRAAIMQAAI
jgi:hypothetical protein